MHRLLICVALLMPATVGLAQDSLCNPCVDNPRTLRPPGEPRGNRFSSPRDATVVVTAEDMRALGVLSAADVIGEIPGLGTEAAGPPRFAIYAALGNELLSSDDLTSELDRVYEYVSDRMDWSVEGPIPLTVEPPNTGNCPARGMASGNGITVFADRDTSREQLLGVLAHEVGHVLHFDMLIGRSTGDAEFTQGLATWAAGRYWTDWQGFASFQDAVRSYTDDGIYVPLIQDGTIGFEAAEQAGSEQCLAERDIFFTEWAAFIDYLVDEHGWETLVELMKTAEGGSRFVVEETGQELEAVNPRQPADSMRVRPTSGPLLDYAAIYDSDLEQLEAAWLESLAADP